MNTLLQTMLQRRSVRKYTGEPVPEEKLKLILQAGLASATSKNRKPWEWCRIKKRFGLWQSAVQAPQRC